MKLWRRAEAGAGFAHSASAGAIVAKATRMSSPEDAHPAALQVTSRKPSPLVLLFIAFGLIVTAALAVIAFKILMVLFAGYLGALVLDAIVTKCVKLTKVPRALALAVLVLVFLGLVVTAVVLFGAKLVEQTKTLIDDVPAALARLRSLVVHAPIAGKTVERSLDQPQPESTKELFAAAMAALGGSLEVVGGLVVMFFIAVYGAAQPSLYADSIVALTPVRDRARVEKVVRSVNENLTRWLVGRLVAMAFVAVTTTIAFTLLGVPMALLFGLFAGLMTFVEYAGALLSGIPPFLFAFTVSPTTALGVGIVFTVLHIIEGYVLTPLLARTTVKLPPAWTLALQALLGFLAGPMGLTFSTPLFVVAVSAVKTWRENDAPSANPRSSAPSLLRTG